MKIGIIGAGQVGRGVAACLKPNPLVTGFVACDRQEECLVRFREEFGAATTRDVAQVLADPAVRLVFVNTSADAHAELTIRALEAGKAVLCEKPMAQTLADSRRMVETAERLRGFLQIGFELRYSLAYTRIKEWIDQGLLGCVVNTHCLYVCDEFWGKGSWKAARAFSGGMFGEKLSHYVDLPRWWIGQPVRTVYSACSPNVVPYYEVRDNYHTTYCFANGAVSHITFFMAVAASGGADPLQGGQDQPGPRGHALNYIVQGTGGAAILEVHGRRLQRHVFADSPQRLTSTVAEVITWPATEDLRYMHNHADQCHDVVRRVAQGLGPMTPARDAFETTRLCFAAELSADARREVALEEIAGDATAAASPPPPPARGNS